MYSMIYINYITPLTSREYFYNNKFTSLLYNKFCNLKIEKNIKKKFYIINHNFKYNFNNYNLINRNKYIHQNIKFINIHKNILYQFWFYLVTAVFIIICLAILNHLIFKIFSAINR
jgi:hypothetical protein